jgi:hypothetical protein
MSALRNKLKSRSLLNVIRKVLHERGGVGGAVMGSRQSSSAFPANLFCCARSLTQGLVPKDSHRKLEDQIFPDIVIEPSSNQS